MKCAKDGDERAEEVRGKLIRSAVRLRAYMGDDGICNTQGSNGVHGRW